jgi:site-specific recombinase XerD
MQSQANLAQMTLLNAKSDFAATWAEAFILDRRVQGKSSHTIRYYTLELKKFLAYLETQSIEKISDILPDSLRSFMLYLTERGQSPGGVHAAYRAVKAFLFWYENEAEPENWKNPARKVKR